MIQPTITTSNPLTSASVKVMRSHDYCHFEVNLSTDIDPSADACAQVDELRKTAARLADKAVEQYKIAKDNARIIESEQGRLDNAMFYAQKILDKPEGERTPQEQAQVKALQDYQHRISLRRRFDYEDEWDEPDEEQYHEPDSDDEATL